MENNCTCNSRTVDETFSNVIHSDDSNINNMENKKTMEKTALTELLEWFKTQESYYGTKYPALEHKIQRVNERMD
jgi:hypothetical protein